MRVPCWLVGHRRGPESLFIRRLDGFPLALYRPCRNCDKRLDILRSRDVPPFDPEMALRRSVALGFTRRE